jgi:predicted DNA-binding WGR domain protein
MNAVILRRIDPTRNMARFYAMDVQPDLFGCILLAWDDQLREGDTVVVWRLDRLA